MFKIKEDTPTPATLKSILSTDAPLTFEERDVLGALLSVDAPISARGVRMAIMQIEFQKMGFDSRIYEGTNLSEKKKKILRKYAAIRDSNDLGTTETYNQLETLLKEAERPIVSYESVEIALKSLMELAFVEYRGKESTQKPEKAGYQRLWYAAPEVRENWKQQRQILRDEIERHSKKSRSAFIALLRDIYRDIYFYKLTEYANGLMEEKTFHVV